MPAPVLPLLGKVAAGLGAAKTVAVQGAKKVASGAKKVGEKAAGAAEKIQETSEKVKESKKFQTAAAAKQQIDQQRQMAEQQKQQQHQRASEMARAKASTGDGAFGKAWMTLKGQTFHPSIEEHLRSRSPQRAVAQIAPRPSPYPNQPSQPVNVETQRGIPAVDEQGFATLPQQRGPMQPGDIPPGKVQKPVVGGTMSSTLGNVNEKMFFNRGHLKERENNRLSESEVEEIRPIMLEYARQLVGEDGKYKSGAPRTVSIKTHQLDEIRRAGDGSEGDTIIATIRPHDMDPTQPQFHTVMYRGSSQPFNHTFKKRFNVEKIHDHSHITRKNREDKDKKKKSINSSIYLSDVLVKDRISPEAMRHKREYDAAYNKRPDQLKYREELNRERRRRGIYGSHDHMDVSHTQGGKLTLEPEHSNRARHFKDKGTLRVVKSMKDDLELLRNLMQGPMDEQDKKIAEAAMAMIEEREGEEDEEDKKLSRPLFGGSHLFL